MKVCVGPSTVAECVWRIRTSQKGLTEETFDSCAPQVQRSCQVLHEPKVKCFSGPRTSQWAPFASTARGAGGNGTSVMCQRLEKKRVTTGPRFLAFQNKRERGKIELLNSPIYSLKVSYAWWTLQVASITSQHHSLSLLFHFPLYFLRPHPPLSLFPL